MRADRLVAILMLLQTRGQVTAAEIAAELEVSERTARRLWDFARAWLRREMETLGDGKSLANK